MHDVSAHDLDDVPDAARLADLGSRTVGDLRRSALAQDALLFCVAFTGGALLVLVVSLLVGSTTDDAWTVGRSDDVLLGGLVSGELFLLWNNGWRQGVRGHSIGKHREGLRVVRVGGLAPTGPARGLARGLVAVVLLDLAVAAVPVGLPTSLRRFTPEAWHVGGAAYVAVLLLVVPLLLGLHRGALDRVAGTEVVKADGDGAVTSEPRRRVLVVLDVVGVLGVLAVCAAHLSFVWPLIWRFPSLF